MDPNYLAFAQQINQAGDFTPTLSSLGRGFDERRMMKMEEDQNQRRNRLADLQYEAADMDNQTRMGEFKSLVNRYGTQDAGPELSDQYAAARGFQADEAQMIAAQERATKAVGDYWGRLDHFAKAGASPEFLTEMTRIGFKADPVLSGIKPDSITYVDKDGMTITDDFPDGALVNPMTGQPMPAGRYSVESKRTGDPNKPYKPIKIEPAKVEMPKHIPEGAAIPDGKGGWVVPAPRKEKPIVIKTGGASGGTVKPMPPAALKMQQESVEAIGLASSLNADLGIIKNQIATGELDLGPFANFYNRGRNLAGFSSEQSRNLQTLDATLEKLRNDSLRLNKGVQTEGDAVRAWNELMKNLNDPKAVSQRIAEIENINARAVELQQANIDNIRENYGKAPLETSRQRNVEPALGKGNNQQSKTAPDKRPPLSAIFGKQK